MAERSQRRERLRAQLERDIKGAARRLLTQGGVESLTLAAIARELGITAPAIYRYFADLQDLIRDLARDLVTELVEHIQSRMEAVPEDEPGVRLALAVREFRAWTLEHHAEFSLLFGTPAQAAGTAQHDLTRDWVCRLTWVFGEPFTALWQRGELSVPAEEEIEPALLDELARYRESAHLDLPLGGVLLFLSCWNRIYGAVCQEAFRHFGFTFADFTPMFENVLRELCDQLGIEYRSPAELATSATADHALENS